ASTNSATWARPVGSREPVPLKLRPGRVNGAAQGTVSPHCGAPPHRLSAGLLGLKKQQAQPMQNLVTVFGGSGFVGAQAVRQLAKAGWRIRVAVRNPNLAHAMRLAGDV